MYPIKFENLYYEKVWGGRDLEKFRENLPKGNIGESWDIACHPNGTGIVVNGEFKGISFDDLIKTRGKDIVGTKVSLDKLPLLLKIINAKEKLSVQVHPTDEYAAKYEGEYGKTEAWYVIDAKENASLIVGTKSCTKEDFEKAIISNDVEKYLNRVNVKRGDFFLINNGLVHAICEGITVVEIQQNSDVTYRVYDYGRPRELHIKKALDVIDLNLKVQGSLEKIETNKDYDKITLCETKYFTIEKYIIREELRDMSNREKFYILTCVEGEGYIEGENFKEYMNIGDSYLIPAALGNYKVNGKLTILKSYPH